jgi:2-methylcitrate dehydratase PrpD
MPETRALATYVVNSRLESIPQNVRHEAKRALLNGLGCAVGGSREPAVDIALRALSPFAGKPIAGVISRTERLDPLHAALINGITTHVFEYDDTLPKNYIHPTPPVASALFAFASANPVNGRDFIHAFLLGFEAESRVGNAVYPAHYDAGWHITSTAGVFGAAVAIGKLLNLSVQQMIWAIGIAATQASGLREMFGSMAKFFHAGRAAQNGYASALLAQAGFNAGEQSIEGPRGFAAVQASHYDLSKITDGLGVDFQILENTYKPYPCGLVVHPTIDGCIQIHNDKHDLPENIREVRLRVAPLVLDLCNKREFTRGLETKYSIYHSAAVGLVRGKAGIREYSDDVLKDPLIRKVRETVSATADSSITEDQSSIEVEYASGQVVRHFVEQSLGNLKCPLSDAQLEDKFRDQATLILPSAQVEKLIQLCWKIDELESVGDVVNASIPI